MDRDATLNTVGGGAVSDAVSYAAGYVAGTALVIVGEGLVDIFDTVYGKK